MCGIIGEFSLELLDQSTFNELLNLSINRGPDCQESLIIDECVQMGFNRLSIQDLSVNGMQPYFSPNKEFYFVFNGEIYNCEELIIKFELDRSKFRSTSDTEVIAHLLEKTTIETIASELNGMYAIAIYSRIKNAISLLRDFVGIKPLFYGVYSKGLVFASQFDQVYKHPAVKQNIKVNASVLKEYFSLGYMQSPNTIYENVFQIEPGSVLTFHLPTMVNTNTYESRFDYKSHPNHKESDAINTQNIDAILSDVISRQLICDVNIGTFLSGGIDSPIITAIASKQKSDIEAFTVKAGGEAFDESKIASEYAKHLGVKNIVAEFSSEDVIATINEHFKAYPEPFGDYSSLPTYLICKLASKNFKVLLSGDGGDELFWGYPRFYYTLKHATRFKQPKWFRVYYAKIERRLGKKVSYGISADTIGDWVLGQHSHNSLTDVDSFFNTPVSFSDSLSKYYQYTGTDANEELMQWLRWNEYYCHMQRVLIKVDRASMGVGLEVRVPFLDKAMVNYAIDIAPDLNNKTPKNLLKRLMTNYFPEQIINQKKMGFTIDIANILHQHCKADFMSLLQSESIVGRELLNMQAIQKYVDDYYLNVHDNNWGVWIIYSYLKWSSLHHA